MCSLELSLHNLSSAVSSLGYPDAVRCVSYIWQAVLL